MVSAISAAPSKGGPYGAGEVRSSQGTDSSNPFNKMRGPIFLSPNSEDIEQRRPQQVVYRELRGPGSSRDGIGGIRRCGQEVPADPPRWVWNGLTKTRAGQAPGVRHETDSRKKRPRPTLTRPSGPLSGNKTPNWCTSPPGSSRTDLRRRSGAGCPGCLRGPR